MTVWLVAAGTLTVAGFGPAMILAYRGPTTHRLLGMALAGATGTLVMLLLCQAFGQSSYLILPLALALLSFAGTLVFTRLVTPGDD